MRIVFIGHSGWDYPHTRIRCYGFAKALKQRGFDTHVLSFKDHLARERSEADMYAALRDRDKMDLVVRAIRRLWPDRKSLLYVQKAHFHSAAPYLLSRFAGARYILDYDDYDVPLSNFFTAGAGIASFSGPPDGMRSPTGSRVGHSGAWSAATDWRSSSPRATIGSYGWKPESTPGSSIPRAKRNPRGLR